MDSDTMSFSAYSNILLPIDFASHTNALVYLALDIADPCSSFIHLVHIVNTGNLPALPKGREISQEISAIGIERFVRIMFRLSKIKGIIEDYNSNIIVKVHVCRSTNMQRAIEWFANRLSTDAITLAEKGSTRAISLMRGFSPALLAYNTGCKVFMLDKENISIHFRDNIF